MSKIFFATTLSLLGLMLGCGSDPATCGVAGGTQQCLCAGGGAGVQACTTDGAWSACDCGGGGADTASSTDTATTGDTATGPDVGGCVPACGGKECGDDGCGGSCGTCGGNETCDAGGQCLCVPDCGDRTCGDDGCGGSCGACISGVEVVTSAKFTTVNDTGCATATCPGGKKVLSGGFHSDASQNERLYDLDRPEGDSGWTVCVNREVEATVYAVCADIADHTIRTAEVTAHTVNGQYSRHEVTVDCAAGEVLLGGGFGPDDVVDRSFVGVPTVIHRAGPGKLSVKFTMLPTDFESPSRNTKTTKAWAVCSKAISPQAASSQVEIAASTAGCALATCPAGTVVLGGFNNALDNQWDNDDGQRWAASRPDAQGWYACYNANGQTTLAVIAVCIAP